MIDQTVFKDSWELLCERFGRDYSGPLMLAYYRSLSPRLSTDQFQQAAARLFDSSKFFPRPDDFLAAGRTNPAAEALEQWEVVQDVMRGFDAGTRLSAEGRRVIGMLGGEHELRMTQLDRVAFVRRDFLQLYGETVAIAQREQKVLTETTSAGRELVAAALEGPEAVLALAAERKEEQP